MSHLLRRATDIGQYDDPHLPWNKHEDSLESPNRKWMFTYLSRFKEKWKGRVVDIGCGTGWLINGIQAYARYAIGIDPSWNNFNRAKGFQP